MLAAIFAAAILLDAAHRGDKNLAASFWGLATGRDDLAGDTSAAEIELEGAWNPSPLVSFGLSAQRNVGRLASGDFAQNVGGVRIIFNLSPDLQLNSLVQYDDESDSVDRTRACAGPSLPPAICS